MHTHPTIPLIDWLTEYKKALDTLRADPPPLQALHAMIDMCERGTPMYRALLEVIVEHTGWPPAQHSSTGIKDTES